MQIYICIFQHHLIYSHEYSMPNSRQKILNYINDQRSSTVEELSKIFQVTPANIRHHLSILIQQGSVRVIGVKRAMGKGRPAQIYSTSQQNDHNNLDQLAGVLLSMIMQFPDERVNNQHLKEVANKMCSEFKIDYPNPTRRLYAAIQSLNHMNYQAHWEAHVENPRIMFDHCPYRAILNDHPELCDLDSSLLESLLSVPVRQIEKLCTDVNGLPQCVFLINRPLS
jgi:predicted ArsR family transcriptional regulator